MSGSLIVLVVLAVLPVVLVLAFAGCGLNAVGTYVPPAQTGQPPGQQPAQPPSGPGTGTPATPPTAPVQYHDAVLADKPLVYWRLDEASGTTAKDSGTAKIDGTYAGGVTLGQIGALEPKDPDKVAAFDGKNGVMTVAYNMLLNPPAAASFSLECWIKPGGDPTGGGWQPTQFVAASRDAAGGKNFGFELVVIRDPDPNPRVLARIGDGVNPFQEVSVALPVGAEQTAWRHVVMSYIATAKTLTLWVTSVTDLKTNMSAPSSGVAYQPNPVNPFRVAAGGGGSPTGFFAGSVDEFALYNPALPDSRVRPHFDASR